MAPPPLIEAIGITKRFGPTLANDHVDLAVQPGEIHALLGENGAGKSTLVKMIYGLLQPTRGAFKWHGEPFVLAGPATARARGIGMVFQHFSLFDNLTVAENVALGLDGAESFAAMSARLAQVSRDYGLPLDPNQPIPEAQKPAAEIETMRSKPSRYPSDVVGPADDAVRPPMAIGMTNRMNAVPTRTLAFACSTCERGWHKRRFSFSVRNDDTRGTCMDDQSEQATVSTPRRRLLGAGIPRHPHVLRGQARTELDVIQIRLWFDDRGSALLREARDDLEHDRAGSCGRQRGRRRNRQAAHRGRIAVRRGGILRRLGERGGRADRSQQRRGRERSNKLLLHQRIPEHLSLQDLLKDSDDGHRLLVGSGGSMDTY
jgi:ABC-type sugar transport system ATPase subunit